MSSVGTAPRSDKWGAENAPKDQYERFWRGVPPKSKGDYGFITHKLVEVRGRMRGYLEELGVDVRERTEG